MAAITEIPGKLDINRIPRFVTMMIASLYSESATTFPKRNAYASAIETPGEWRHTPIDDSVRRFIKLEKSFLQQLSQHISYFGDQTEYVLLEKMKISSELLLHCSPGAISLQL